MRRRKTFSIYIKGKERRFSWSNAKEKLKLKRMLKKAFGKNWNK